MASSNMIATLREEERLQAELDQAREELLDSIVAIQDRVVEAFDWKTVVRRRPVAALLGGLAVGFVLARLLTARRKDER